MRRFCYRCGALEADAGPLINGLCQKCFAEGVELLKAPSKVRVVLCKNCEAYAFKGIWGFYEEGSSLDDLVKDLTLQSLQVVQISAGGKSYVPALLAPGMEIEVRPKLDSGSVEVLARGKIHELQKWPMKETVSIKLVIDYRKCDVCALKRGSYYEAIFQLRGEVGSGEYKKAREELEGLAEEESRVDPKSFITYFKMVRGGVDYYISSLALGRKMSALLKKRGVRARESSKLVGQTRDGKRKYRVTILTRLPQG